jgi:RimJ/RimL family protein N-acetyltransferase
VLFLSGQRIYARPIEMSDIPLIQRWINDPQTRRNLMNVRPLNEIAERKFVESAGESTDDVRVAIVLRDGDRHIGVMGLHPIHWTDRNTTFGILIGEPDCRGKGLGTEATRLMLQHAFETLNLNRVQLHVYATNPAGMRTYEKAGFVREGVLREHHFGEGAYCDVYCYGMLAREYFAQTRST